MYKMRQNILPRKKDTAETVLYHTILTVFLQTTKSFNLCLSQHEMRENDLAHSRLHWLNNLLCTSIDRDLVHVSAVACYAEFISGKKSLQSNSFFPH